MKLLVYLTRDLCELISTPRQLTDDMKHFFAYDDVR